MGRLVHPTGKQEDFTQVPNRVIRSELLDPYEKAALLAIMSCGKKSFPSYDAIMKWVGCGRAKLSECIRRLEGLELIERYQDPNDGRKVFYRHYWNPNRPPGELIRFVEKQRGEFMTAPPSEAKALLDALKNGSPGEPTGDADAGNISSPGEPNDTPSEPEISSVGELIDAELVRQANQVGSLIELNSVRQANAKKSTEKQNLKTPRLRAGVLDGLRLKRLSSAGARRWIRRPWWKVRAALDDFLLEAEPRAG